MVEAAVNAGRSGRVDVARYVVGESRMFISAMNCRDIVKRKI